MVEILAVLPMVLFVAGTGLILLEAVVPGGHSMVFGVALFGAGLVGLFIPAANTPIVLAGLVALFGAIAFYGYQKLFDLSNGDGSQTLDSDGLVGAEGYVTQRVTQREGRVELKGGGFSSTYSARVGDSLDEIEEGADVVVVDAGGGNIVRVEPKK